MLKKSEIIKKEMYYPKDIANMLGITTRTVANYADKGLINAYKTESGQRRITGESLCQFLQAKGLLVDDTMQNKNDYIYARVSTHKQKDSGDLDRQINHIKLYAINHNPQNIQTLSDVGSGLNDNRKNLNKLLQLVQQDKVNRIFIMYKDRLTRFGFNYIKQVCDFHNVEIVIVSNEENDKSLSEELAEDIIAIIHSFSGKLYGMRNKMSKALDNIQDE